MTAGAPLPLAEGPTLRVTAVPPTPADLPRRIGISPTGAVLISVGMTGALIGGALASTEAEGTDARTALLVATGMLIGPSAGNIVIGNLRGALIGSGLRLAGGAIGLSGAGAAFMNDGDLTLPYLLVASGAVVYLGGTAYDIISAGTHAHRARLRPTATGLTLTVGL